MDKKNKGNAFFDFTDAQLKFLAVLTGAAMLTGGYLLISSHATPTTHYPPFKVILGDDEQVYTGIFVLDPNTAPADSLELLPGIGKILADRIVAYRKEHRFNEPVDITEVKGIGPKTYERIRPYLRIQRQ